MCIINPVWILNLGIPPLQVSHSQVTMQLLISFWVPISTEMPEALLATKLHSEIPISVCSYGTWKQCSFY